MTRRREVKRLAFRAGDLGGVVASMARLAEAGDGWINLLPAFAGADEDQPTSLRFLTLFGGGGMGITMATWVPPGVERRDRDRPRLGIAHVAGRRVVRELAAQSVPVPATWIVEQDHPRRGLVVRPPADEPHQAVLEWAIRAIRAIRAIGALSAPRVVEGWRADVYAPLDLDDR